MKKTGIQWTDSTWNPVRGCSIVSPGCSNCYAMKQAHRFSGEGKPYEGLTKMTKGGPVWTGDVALVEERLDDPEHWRKPRRVFVNSMSDLFHEGVPDDYIRRVFAVMAMARSHVFQILTKRPERMCRLLQKGPDNIFGPHTARAMNDPDNSRWRWPLPNVWLGVTAEDQTRFDERIAHLADTPAAVHFLSCEPLLGPLDMMGPQKGGWLPEAPPDPRGCRSFIDWVIVGGESGPRARPCRVEWIRDVVRQCREAGVAVFVKQLGSHPVFGDEEEGAEVYVTDRKGGDPIEWPPDLRVREYPE